MTVTLLTISRSFHHKLLTANFDEHVLRVAVWQFVIVFDLQWIPFNEKVVISANQEWFVNLTMQKLDLDFLHWKHCIEYMWCIKSMHKKVRRHTILIEELSLSWLVTHGFLPRCWNLLVFPFRCCSVLVNIWRRHMLMWMCPKSHEVFDVYSS